LRQEQGREVRKDREAELVEEQELHVKKWDRDEDENKKEFCGQQIPPLIWFGNPPLAVPYQRFVLNHSDTQKYPEKEGGRGDVATCKTGKSWTGRVQGPRILPRVE
jgi:hypothetical protein